MLKENLGICPYEENYCEEEFTKMQDDIKKTDEESDKSDEELIEIISPKKDENTTDWYDKNKLKKILATIDRNNFNHKNKISKIKFNDINSLINNIKIIQLVKLMLKRK